MHSITGSFWRTCQEELGEVPDGEVLYYVVSHGSQGPRQAPKIRTCGKIAIRGWRGRVQNLRHAFRSRSRTRSVFAEESGVRGVSASLDLELKVQERVPELASSLSLMCPESKASSYV